MNKNAELIALCQRLTSDGQLSGEEVWILAKWLNDHPEAGESWPGNILVEPLEAAYADGELDLEEMQRMANLLVQVEKECAGATEDKEAPEETAPAETRSSPAVESLLRLPVIPPESAPRSSEESEYVVNLTDQTCTCADWKKSRQHLPAGHLGRACKHIVEKILSTPEAAGFNPILLGILNECRWRSRGTNAFDQYVPLSVNGQTVLLAYSEGEWVNVFAPV
jgi:hypothetical protein